MASLAISCSDTTEEGTNTFGQSHNRLEHNNFHNTGVTRADMALVLKNQLMSLERITAHQKQANILNYRRESDVGVFLEGKSRVCEEDERFVDPHILATYRL